GGPDDLQLAAGLEEFRVGGLQFGLVLGKAVVLAAQFVAIHLRAPWYGARLSRRRIGRRKRIPARCCRGSCREHRREGREPRLPGSRGAWSAPASRSRRSPCPSPGSA